MRAATQATSIAFLFSLVVLPVYEGSQVPGHGAAVYSNHVSPFKARLLSPDRIGGVGKPDSLSALFHLDITIQSNKVQFMLFFLVPVSHTTKLITCHQERTRITRESL
jgi:hypothetical protein